jgi:imidazolonepropionase-like amidohydrolase/pimeloyl-ACP methyl ester carboxylesterase
MCLKMILPLLLIGGPFCTNATAQSLPSLDERIVQVNGHDVQIWTGGPDRPTGAPLIVFQNGWNAGADTWSHVAPELAKSARVLLYNRGGAGGSEWDGQLPTIAHIGQLLRDLLDALDAPPPYLLVGHSAGGPYIRGFAARHPESVAGLVYVDPSSSCILESAFERGGSPGLASVLVDAPGRRDAVGVHPNDLPSSAEPGTLQLPPVPVVLLIGLDVGIPPPQAAMLRERGVDVERVSAEARRGKIPCLIPYAFESPHGEVIATPRSGHNIHIDEPELVISAVRRVLEQSMTDSAGSRSRGVAQTARARIESSGTTLLTNATIIDGTGAPPRPGAVLIEDGRIRQVLAAGERAGPTADTVDVAGGYLIPGLINSHVHLAGLGSREAAVQGLRRMFYSGVTSVREMVGDTRQTGELARAALSPQADLPSIHYAALMAGPTFFTDPRVAGNAVGYAPGEAPWAQAIDEATDLPLAAARAAGTGATGIKIYADLPAPLVSRVVEEAHRQGLQAWAHGTLFPTRPREVVSAGVDGITHVCGLVWQVLPDVPSRYAERGAFDPGQVDVRSQAFRDLWAEMRLRRTVLDPTASFFQNPRARELGCTQGLVTSLLRSAHQAGVPMSTGTDYLITEGEPDPTLFKEISYLVESGILDPAEALTAATLHGALAIGVADQVGSIQEGRIADLVILSEDPTRDIAALRQVVAVIKAGIVHWRTDYAGSGDGLR